MFKQLGRLNEAVEDCTSAISLDKKHFKALLCRAKCYLDLKQYENAINDFNKIIQEDESQGN